MARVTSASTRSSLLTRPLASFGGLLRGRGAVVLRESVLVAALAGVALLAYGLNMFHYPAFTFTDDEGITAAQAWAVLQNGALSPYTYVYDSPPAGTLLVAAWEWLTGRIGASSGAIDHGRTLMLALHVLMIPLLYQLVRKLGGGVAAATLAAALISISPLAVFYGRLLRPDTIMIFWTLLSLHLLLDGWGRLSRLLLSGVCFGIAVLTREIALIFLPAFLFIAFQQRWEHQGRFALAGWAVPAAMVISLYPLFALLKGELWPNVTPGGINTADGYAGAGISLLQSLWTQASAGGGGPFNLSNDFWGLLRSDWLVRDPLLIGGGAAAVALNLLRGLRLRVGWPALRDRAAVAAGLLGLLPLAYLARGGMTLNTEIVLAVPFLALNLALLLAPLLRRLRPRVAAPVVLASAVALAVGFWVTGRLTPLYAAQPDEPAREALAWIKQNLPADSRMIVRDDLFTDLRSATADGPAFPNAHSQWKVAGDPDIRDGVFNNDWRRVDYVVLQPGLTDDFAASNNQIALQALANARLVKRWTAPAGYERLHPRQSIELWQVASERATAPAMLARGSVYIDARFGRDGAYREADGRVTSEAQSYALLRAVWSDDRARFNQTWQWTRRNLMRSDGLLAWNWRDGAIVDANGATDADVDTAYALLLAGRRWDDRALTDAGRTLVRAIWANEVVIVNGAPYLAAGNWATTQPIVAVNPSYFAPYALRVFAEVDPERNWRGLIDSGYRVLFESSAALLGGERSSGLPPDWVGLDRASGGFVPLRFDQGDTTRYGYDAARVYWRMALDSRFSGDGRAEAYLRTAGFLQDEVRRKGYVSGVYAHDGTVLQEAPTLVGIAGGIAALLTLDAGAAQTMFAGQLLGGMTNAGDGAFWGNRDDLYGQEWAWFGTALYIDAIRNVWVGN